MYFREPYGSTLHIMFINSIRSVYWWQRAIDLLELAELGVSKWINFHGSALCGLILWISFKP